MNSKDNQDYQNILKPKLFRKTPISSTPMKKNSRYQENSKNRENSSGDQSAMGDNSQIENATPTENPNPTKPLSRALNNKKQLDGQSTNVSRPTPKEENATEECPLMECNSEPQLPNTHTNRLKVRVGVTRSETLVKTYSLQGPIEEKGCGEHITSEDESNIKSSIEEKNEIESFQVDNLLPRSVSPCLTDPNSIALVDGSPSPNVGFESIYESPFGNDNFCEEDPLLAGWDDEDLFMYRSSIKCARKQFFNTQIKRQDTYIIDDSNTVKEKFHDVEDDFSSCCDSSSEIDLTVDKEKRKKVRHELISPNFNKFVSPITTGSIDENVAQRSSSAPQLNNRRPPTPWPSKQQPKVAKTEKKSKVSIGYGTIVKTVVVSGIVAAIAFFCFPWHE